MLFVGIGEGMVAEVRRGLMIVRRLRQRLARRHAGPNGTVARLKCAAVVARVDVLLKQLDSHRPQPAVTDWPSQWGRWCATGRDAEAPVPRDAAHPPPLRAKHLRWRGPLKPPYRPPHQIIH